MSRAPSAGTRVPGRGSPGPYGPLATLVALWLAPLPAFGIGLHAMAESGIPSEARLLNAAALGAGLLAGFLAAGWRCLRSPGGGPPRTLVSATLLGGLTLVGLTLLAPGVEGVHRWLPLGPVRVHAAALVLPGLLVLLSRVRVGVAWVVGLCVLTVLLAQPDAAQAASFGAGWIALDVVRRGRAAWRSSIPVGLISAASMLRPDPLGPVPHVEGIVGLAASEGGTWLWGAILSLVLLPLVLVLIRDRESGLPLAAYTSGTLVAAGLGHHPVPIMGYGVSPILGYYGAVTAILLTGVRARTLPCAGRDD